MPPIRRSPKTTVPKRTVADKKKIAKKVGSTPAKPAKPAKPSKVTPPATAGRDGFVPTGKPAAPAAVGNAAAWKGVADGTYQVTLPDLGQMKKAYAWVEKKGEQLTLRFSAGEFSRARGLDTASFSQIAVKPNGDFEAHADPLRDAQRRPVSSDWANLKGNVALVGGKIVVRANYEEKRLGPVVPHPQPDDPATSHPVYGVASGSFYDQDKVDLVSIGLGGSCDPKAPEKAAVQKTFQTVVHHDNGSQSTMLTSVVLDPALGSFLRIQYAGGTDLSPSYRLPLTKVGDKYTIDTLEDVGDHRALKVKGAIENGLVTLNVTSIRHPTDPRSGRPDVTETWLNVAGAPMAGR